MKKSDHDDIDSARSAAMRDTAGRFLWDLEGDGGVSSARGGASGSSGARRGGHGSTYKRSQRNVESQGVEGLGLRSLDAAYSDEAEEYMGQSRQNSSFSFVKNLCLVVVFVALLVASTHLYTRNNNNDGVSDGSNGGMKSSSSSQQETTTTTSAGLTDRINSLKTKLTQDGITGNESFETAGSPQRNALLWIANEDEAQLDVGHDGFVQRYILAVLYFMTNGYGQTDSDYTTIPASTWTDASNWLSGSKGVCLWHGIECEPWRQNHEDQHTYKVLGIELSNNLLKGSLPSELQAMTNLNVLDFSKNQLSGEVPTDLLTMPLLRFIFLRDNNFHGSLGGDWESGSVLQELHLGENNFDGTIPDEINKVTTLTALGLDRNKFVGTLPDVSTLTNMKILFFDRNLLTGSISSSFGSLSRLQDFRVSENKLEGTMPSEICDISSLEVLYADCDKISCSCCKCE